MSGGASLEQAFDLHRCIADLHASRAAAVKDMGVTLDTVIAALLTPGYVGESERFRLAALLTTSVREPLERLA